MCLASVYVKEADKEKLVADRVTRIQLNKETGEIQCVNLFGERVNVIGSLEYIDLQNARVNIVSK